MPDGTLATWCNTQSRWLHGGYQTRITKKPRYLSNSRVFFVYLGWLMGHAQLAVTRMDTSFQSSVPVCSPSCSPLLGHVSVRFSMIRPNSLQYDNTSTRSACRPAGGSCIRLLPGDCCHVALWIADPLLELVRAPSACTSSEVNRRGEPSFGDAPIEGRAAQGRDAHDVLQAVIGLLPRRKTHRQHAGGLVFDLRI